MLSFVIVPLKFNPYSFKYVNNVDGQNCTQITL
jgi:hypothetical protein